MQHIKPVFTENPTSWTRVITQGSLFTFMLLLSCTRQPPIPYADALKICLGENQASNQVLNIPKPDCFSGALFPDFECVTIDQQKIDRAYFAGKVSIVNFWFEGCAPCVAEIPGFNQLVSKYGTEKLRFLAISRDSQDDVISFLQKHPWRFDHVSNGDDIIMGVFQCPWGYPTTFLIDPNGVIVKVVIGGVPIDEAAEHIQAALIPAIDLLLKR